MGVVYTSGYHIAVLPSSVYVLTMNELILSIYDTESMTI